MVLMPSEVNPRSGCNRVAFHPLIRLGNLPNCELIVIHDNAFLDPGTLTVESGCAQYPNEDSSAK